jgi:anti-anti-sigma factor
MFFYALRAESGAIMFCSDAIAGDERTWVVRGELTGINAVLLFNRIQADDSLCYSTCTIDLSKVTYIDSSSLGGLIHCHKVLEKTGKSLILADTREHALMLFRGCRLDRVLKLKVLV